MISRKSLRLAAAALTVTVGLALAGCGNIQPGVAAKVGDQTISMSFLDAQVQWYHNQPKAASEPPSTKLILWQLVVVQLFDDLGKQEGVTPTAAEIRQAEAEFKSRAKTIGPISPDMVTTIARGTLLQESLKAKLGGEAQYVAAVQKKAEEVGVRINPRYGTWNNADFMRTGPDSFGSGALVKPATQPTQPALPQVGQPAPEQ
ncbi:SurA N-terminal domain-containing protein [Flindersiella endophytica]